MNRTPPASTKSSGGFYFFSSPNRLFINLIIAFNILLKIPGFFKASRRALASSSSSSEKFETINSVGELSYNSQHCPAIQAGDMILINGGKVSDYTLKILFEEVQLIVP